MTVSLTPEQEEKLDKVYDAVIRVVRRAVDRLYHLPIQILELEDPSMDDILNLCQMFLDLVDGTAIHAEFSEGVSVIGQAAQAVKDRDEAQLVDCAYHLEDFLDRIDR